MCAPFALPAADRTASAGAADGSLLVRVLAPTRESLKADVLPPLGHVTAGESNPVLWRRCPLSFAGVEPACTDIPQEQPSRGHQEV